MKKITYDDVLYRLGYFRQRANLSAREASFMLDKGELYVTRIENNKVELKVSTLLSLMDVYNISIQDFFYLGKNYNENDKNLIDLFNGLSEENKQFAIDFIKKLH